MITSILEFYFSNHYLYDKDNRFTKRVKNVKILNKLKDIEAANARLKRVLYYLALDRLDARTSSVNNAAVVFGDISFKENGNVFNAKLETEDGYVGNTYVAIVTKNLVITIKIYEENTSNIEILKDADKSSQNGIEKLISLLGGTELELSSNNRDSIIIDLDESFSSFAKKWPVPNIKNNPYSNEIGGLSYDDIDWISAKGRELADAFSPAVSMTHMTDLEMLEIKAKGLIKECVIGEGDRIWVSYPNGPKEKTIKSIKRVEVNNIAYEIEFENTAKKVTIQEGSDWIITPKSKNDKYAQLLMLFDIKNDTDLSFKGKIRSITYYKAGKSSAGSKHKLGILIDPRSYF